MYPKNMNAEELFSLEYSISQDAFHIDTLSTMLDINAAMVRDDRANDYKLLAIAPSHEQAVELSKQLREVLEQNKLNRPAGSQ